MKTSINEFLSQFQGKKILVLGLGIQGGGVGVVRFFVKHGAKVTVYDDKDENTLATSIRSLANLENVEYLLSGRKPNDISSYEFVIKGPSFRWNHEIVLEAQKKQIKVHMEAALFMKYAPCKVVGITGTRGKSTTTMMVYRVLSEYYKKGKVLLAGNLPGSSTIELLDMVSETDITVLELSSWQLSGLHRLKCSPEYSVVTGIFEDHLNYYSSMRDYIYDKCAVYAYQKDNDHLVIADRFAIDFFEIVKPTCKNVYKVSDKLFLSSLVHLRGLHNMLNASLAKKVCEAILQNVNEIDIEKVISLSKNMPSRQEIVGQFDNVEVINDSASTTPIACIAALNTFHDKDLVLILGGNSKNLSYEDLLTSISSKSSNIKAIFLLTGSFTDEIITKLKELKEIQIFVPYPKLQETVKNALEFCKSMGKPVYLLFSPGATSFAQFKNEFDRGEKFVESVRQYI
ncbi:MAG: UDP-N-acetylmuramoyl-L-alanine--D-glutamate ligase [Patescibacteria group bacterium]